MAKTKQKTQEPSFSHFAHASVFNQPLARRMLKENPAWLTVANGIGETALADVVIENYLDAARFLLDAGADINTRDMSAATPLMQAAGLGYQEMVALLLERGAEVNAHDEDHETAIFKAVRYGYIEICEALIAAGAEVQIENDMGEALADVALRRKSEQVRSVLVKHGYQEAAPPAV